MNNNDFAQHVLRKVVADICSVLGFHAVRSSAVDVLGDLLAQSIIEIGRSSVEYANLCGRTECNFQDVKNALEEKGFKLRDLYDYAMALNEHANEQPVNVSVFEFDIPEFPRPKTSKLERQTKPEYLKPDGLLEISTSENQQTPQPPIITPQTNILQTQPPGGILHPNAPTITQPPPPQPPGEEQFKIPEFLPPLPPKHTWTFTPVYRQRLKDQSLLQKMKTKQKGQIEQSLTRIHSADLIKKSRYNENRPPLFEEEAPEPFDVSLMEEDEPPSKKKKLNQDEIVNPYLLLVKENKNIQDHLTTGIISSVTEKPATIDGMMEEEPPSQITHLLKPPVTVENVDVTQLAKENLNKTDDNQKLDDKEGKRRKADELLSIEYKTSADLESKSLSNF